MLITFVVPPGSFAVANRRRVQICYTFVNLVYKEDNNVVINVGLGLLKL